MGLVGLVVRNALMPEAPTPEQITEVGQMASRWGIGSLLILFFLGAVFLKFVDEEKGKQEAVFLADT